MSSSEEFSPALTGSGLKVEGDRLVQRDVEGEVVQSHPLSEILAVDLKSYNDKTALAMGGVLITGGLIALRLVPGYGVMIFGLCTVLGLLLLAGAKSTRLRIETPHGDIFHDLAESSDEASGFLVALRRSIADAQTRALES